MICVYTKQMDNYKYSYPLIKLPSAGIFSHFPKKYFIGFCILWLVIAVFEVAQDYISAMLNDSSFILAESLSYKLFWLLFIPLSLALDYGITKADRSLAGVRFVSCTSLLVLSVTLIHLIIFSLILYGVSNLIHENPVTLLYLVYEKLSTRLYIALSVYIALTLLYLLVKHRRAREKTPENISPTTMTIKTGKNSMIVDIADISWIGSDGAYLDIHTVHKKYVVMDSLKNIITTLPQNFKRIHRSTIANISQVSSVKSRGNGDYDIIMDDGKKLRVSRNYAKPLKGLIL